VIPLPALVAKTLFPPFFPPLLSSVPSALCTLLTSPRAARRFVVWVAVCFACRAPVRIASFFVLFARVIRPTATVFSSCDSLFVDDLVRVTLRCYIVLVH